MKDELRDVLIAQLEKVKQLFLLRFYRCGKAFGLTDGAKRSANTELTMKNKKIKKLF